MPQKKNILVFPCGSEIALDIHSSVKYSTYFNLIGANSVDDHGQYVYKDYIDGIPFVNDPEFIPTLAEIVKERKIDAIYPAMDTVITMAKMHEEDLGCKVIAPPAETTEICLSKKLTYEKLAGIVNIPKVYNPANISPVEFPVFAKPIVGYSAKGTKKLNSQDEVNNYLEGKDNMLVVEYLPGEEFTVDCFTDKEGNLLYSGARKRNRVSNGISVNTYFAENQKEFEELAGKINSAIRFRGAWFYQVKRNKNGHLTLLEIAARLGGSSLLSRAVGVNFALLTLFDAFDYKVGVFKNDYNVVLDRALESKYKTDLKYDSVYCDYDDCLILDKTTVNIELVKFLYKCINEKKKIYLLSKHEHTDLFEELKKFRLDHLFDEVIHIEPNANKANYIHSSNAIFIDDSNAERLNIKTKLNIPVFAPEMIDVLM